MDIQKIANEAMEKIAHIAGDFVIVALLIISATALSRLGEMTYPPHGPIMFDGLPFALRLQWLVQGFETAIFLTFGWRSVRRFSQ